SLELMTPVDYILRESKNCNMWWTHTRSGGFTFPYAILASVTAGPAPSDRFFMYSTFELSTSLPRIWPQRSEKIC
ncbi:hypothetical protein EJ887_07865, partial [Klebsiella pneumoniae subsp. pneumoniae]